MTQAIFLSYASEDAAAARRICEALRAAGLEVWFDQSELRGGDAWDASIRRQIKDCALFVPVISANTESRPEGYFRLEWKLAVDRSHLMADDRAFFFPVVLGDVAEPTARVPEKFRERQWTRLGIQASDGSFDDAAVRSFAERIAILNKVQAESASSSKSASNNPSNGEFGFQSAGAKTAAPTPGGAQVLRPSREQPDFDPGLPPHSLPKDDLERDGSRSEVAPSTRRPPAKPSTSNKSPLPRRIGLIAATVFLVFVGGIGVQHFRSTNTSNSANSANEINSIAVLPFQVPTNPQSNATDADTDYLSVGLAETLIYQLSRLPKLKVSPASSVYRYKGKEIDPLKVGADLSVAAVMTGRLVKRGESLSISVELVDVRNKKSLWGERYERKMADLLATQRDIATEITRKLQLGLSGESQLLAAKRYTNSNDAYQAYLKGRYLYQKRGKDNLKRSVEHFREAIRLDPQFALAYVGVAESYAFISFLDRSEDPLTNAMSAAKRALEIDPNLAEAHGASASLSAIDWDWENAERSYKRALELDDTVGIIHYFYAMNFLLPNGRIQEGISHVERALALEPMSIAYAANLARAHLYAGQPERALIDSRKVFALEPTHPSSQGALLSALLAYRQYEEAIRIGESISPESRSYSTYDMLALAYALAGRASDARKALASPQLGYGGSLATVALVQAALGERDAAFASLEGAFKKKDFDLVYLNVDPRFAPLRDDPRFASLVKRMGLSK